MEVFSSTWTLICLAFSSVDVSFVDGGWAFCAISFPCIRAVNSKVVRKKTFPDAIVLLLDLLRGAAFFPFIILIVGYFSSTLLLKFVEHERITLLLAGLIGASAVFKADKWIVDRVKANPHFFE